MENIPVVAARVVQEILAVSKFPDGPLHLEIFGFKAEPTLRLGFEAGLVPGFHLRFERFVDGVEFLAEVVEIEVVMGQCCKA